MSPTSDSLAEYLEFQFALLEPDDPANKVPLVEVAHVLEGDFGFASDVSMALDPHGPTASVGWLAWRALILDGVNLGVLELREFPDATLVPPDQVWEYLTRAGGPGAPSEAQYPTSVANFYGRVTNSYLCIWPGPQYEEFLRMARECRPFADLQGD